LEFPPVAVAADKFDRGADNLAQLLSGDGLELLPIISWKSAFETFHPTDAHFVTYLPRDAQEGDKFCRCNKPIRSALIEHGSPLEARILAFDFDLPGHAAWTEAYAGEAVAAMNEAADKEPLAAQWAVWYATLHGWRMIYVLKSTVDVLMAEAVHRTMVLRFQQTPLVKFVDTAASDWTRLFRCPRVVRERVRTDLDAFFDYRTQEVVIDPWEIHPHVPDDDGKRFAYVVPTDPSRRPDPDTAKTLISTERGSRTEWHAAALSRLKGRDVLAYIKGEKKIEEDEKGNPTTRNNHLTQLVGASVGMLFYKPESTTPELVYALWVDPVEQLQARTGTDSGRDWIEILWDVVRHCWDKEAAQAEHAKIEKIVGQEQSGKLSVVVLEGIRKWCKDPRFYGDDTSALMAALRVLIATDGSGHFYPMRGDGTYDPEPTTQTSLHARIRELGMDALIELEVHEEKGTRQVHVQTLINKHATRFFNREGVATGTIQGGYVRDLGTDAAALMFRLYGRRTDLIPAFSNRVDTWLRRFAGDHYPEIENWISHAPAFDEGPICALSLNGPPGIGKKLLVEGLAECITTQTVAHAKEMTGRFQSQILKTCFLSVDEGFPRVSRDGAQDPADIFRAMVSGDTMHVEQKGRGIISIHNPLRVIITGNNDEIIRSIYTKNLSPNDRRALGMRLLHCNLDDGGARWLMNLGGLEYTKGWIRGDDGSPSNFEVARHFLWLYKNRVKPPFGQRFLVQGDPNSDLVTEMATSSGDAPEIIEVIVDMLCQRELRPGVLVHENEYHVTVSAVKDHVIVLYRQRGWAALSNRLTLRRIHSVLQGLSVDGWDPYPRRLPDKDSPSQRWWRLDKTAILRHASIYGLVLPEALKT